MSVGHRDWIRQVVNGVVLYSKGGRPDPYDADDEGRRSKVVSGRRKCSEVPVEIRSPPDSDQILGWEVWPGREGRAELLRSAQPACFADRILFRYPECQRGEVWIVSGFGLVGFSWTVL